MKIFGLSNIYGVYKTQSQKTSEVSKTGKIDTKKDALNISNTAKDYQTAAKAVSKVPDIRQDRIDDVRAKMQADAYFASENDIADKMLAL